MLALNLVNTDLFQTFKSFSVFGKTISNHTKLPYNLPFDLSVINITTMNKIKNLITLFSQRFKSLDRRKMQCCQKHYSSLLRFQAFVYRKHFQFLNSIRVHFLPKATETHSIMNPWPGKKTCHVASSARVRASRHAVTNVSLTIVMLLLAYFRPFSVCGLFTTC